MKAAKTFLMSIRENLSRNVFGVIQLHIQQHNSYT